MYELIYNTILRALEQGICVTVGSPFYEERKQMRQNIIDAFDRVSAIDYQNSYRNTLTFKNGAFVQFVDTKRPTGDAYLHTDLLFLLNIAKSNPRLVLEAHSIVYGSPGTIIEVK